MLGRRKQTRCYCEWSAFYCITLDDAVRNMMSFLNCTVFSGIQRAINKMTIPSYKQGSRALSGDEKSSM